MSELRRGLIGSESQEPSSQYIQDGLIMYLDCLDTENCANNYWKDTINNIEFSGNSEWSTRGFKFNGPNSGTYLKSDAGYINSTLSDIILTVEVVAESVNFTDWGVLLADGEWHHNELQTRITPVDIPNSFTWSSEAHTGFSKYNNGYAFKLPVTKSDIKNMKFVISQAYGGKHSDLKQGYFNKQEMQFDDSVRSDFTDNADTLSIGCRYVNSWGQGTGIFNGYIKCIRLYNRKLTSEEMLHNQSIDNIRFNLGL